MLWWRATGTVPARIEIQYLHDRWAAPVTKADLERTERACAKDIAAAVQAIGRQPAPARAGADCARCPVRARCDDWARALPQLEGDAARTAAEVTAFLDGLRGAADAASEAGRPTPDVVTLRTH